MDKTSIIQKLLTHVDTLGRQAASRRFTPTPKGMPTHAQIGILFVVLHYGPQSIKDIATKFGMTPSAVTQLVNPLVTDHLLERTEDVHDRRKICVALSPKGKSKMEAIKKARYTTMTTILEPLNTQELIQLEHILEKIVNQTKTIWTRKQPN